ncbi:MAG: FGGY-family carbohydrate kinase [Pseudomonadota bacterium]
MGRVLAVDIGASSLKLGLFAPDGPSLAQAEAPTGAETDPDGRSEIDPARWRAALDRALAEAARAAGGLGEVAAVCACGMTRTQVLVDAEGSALRPALGVLDTRAAAAAARGRAIPGLKAPARDEAARLDASHPAARLAWLRREAPEAWDRAAAAIEPKDWLNALLTGVPGSDPISMERLSAAQDSGLAAAMGVDRDLRAPLTPPEGVMGRVRPGLGGALDRLAGARVLSGCHDARMAAAGLGALRPGGAYVISGTTESSGLLAPSPAQAEGLLTVRWDDGLWQIGGPGLNGASIRDWAARLGAPAPSSGPPPARPLLFLPFLNGERTPVWNGDLRAAFLGLDAGHGPADLVRAAMEGLGFLNRWVIERAEAASGLRADRVALSGGGAAAPWPEIRAAALGRPVEVPVLRHAGLAGCAAAALVALGRAGSLTEAARAVCGPPRIAAPDPASAARMDGLFEIFQEAVAPVAALSTRLARLPRTGAEPAE